MISKGDAARQNDELHADQLAAAEKVVDRVLAREYSSGRSVTIASSLVNLDYYQRPKLIARYQKSGWNVKWTDDQREGAWYTFS